MHADLQRIRATGWQGPALTPAPGLLWCAGGFVSRTGCAAAPPPPARPARAPAPAPRPRPKFAESCSGNESPAVRNRFLATEWRNGFAGH